MLAPSNITDVSREARRGRRWSICPNSQRQGKLQRLQTVQVSLIRYDQYFIKWKLYFLENAALFNILGFFPLAHQTCIFTTLHFFSCWDQSYSKSLRYISLDVGIYIDDSLVGQLTTHHTTLPSNILWISDLAHKLSYCTKHSLLPIMEK